MKDALGNTIRDGDLILWDVTPETLARTVFRVLKVQDQGTVTIEGDTAPGILVIGIPFPITAKPTDNLVAFKCLRNPESETTLNELMEKVPGRMQ
jgi:hypothetical protein